MTGPEKGLLRLCSRFLEYPDTAMLEEAREILADLRMQKQDASQFPESMTSFLDWLSGLGLAGAQEHYVRIFDHDPGASLYLSWHRYGNDRGQGKAMAALNGLYRAAGFEPVQGILPDYLPRVLEFLAICDDWAVEALLDGFGPEMAAIEKHLTEMESPYAALLQAATGPLRDGWPSRMNPRNQPDRTIRPMARPEIENPLFDALPDKRIADR